MTKVSNEFLVEKFYISRIKQNVDILKIVTL